MVFRRVHFTLDSLATSTPPNPATSPPWGLKRAADYAPAQRVPKGCASDAHPGGRDPRPVMPPMWIIF